MLVLKPQLRNLATTTFYSLVFKIPHGHAMKYEDLVPKWNPKEHPNIGRVQGATLSATLFQMENATLGKDIQLCG